MPWYTFSLKTLLSVLGAAYVFWKEPNNGSFISTKYLFYTIVNYFFVTLTYSTSRCYKPQCLIIVPLSTSC